MHFIMCLSFSQVLQETEIYQLLNFNVDIVHEIYTKIFFLFFPDSQIIKSLLLYGKIIYMHNNRRICFWVVKC